MKTKNKNTIKKPTWLRIKATQKINYKKIKSIIEDNNLNTVCYSSSCPNMSHCWERKTATFLIMGNQCTRSCRFCSIKTSKKPSPLDESEPKRLANSVKIMKLSHVVITSVCRDDIIDCGAQHFSNCISKIHKQSPESSIEILAPDFLGNYKHIDTVLKSNPDIFNHNIETVENLSNKIRDKSNYITSLKVLDYVKKKYPKIKTKSGLMLGLGESLSEVRKSLIELKNISVDFITIGQYLQPNSKNIKVIEYITPLIFKQLSEFAYKLGFTHVESGPLVRSSFQAKKY